VYDGSTTIDSSVFASPDSLIDFMFINGPTPICANGVNGPDLATHQGSFSFSTSCTVTVTAAHPTVRFFLNLPAFVNAPGGSWSLDMLHTATLDLGDLGGRTVYSGSGVFPGTEAATPVPEPASLMLVGLGLTITARRFGRRAR
jgi:PEP-CTERM motif